MTVTNGTSVDNVVIYDGQDNTGTSLGILLMGETKIYTITSGYLYAEWDDLTITDDITFAEDGSEIGNPVQVISNMNLVTTIIEYKIFTLQTQYGSVQYVKNTINTYTLTGKPRSGYTFVRWSITPNTYTIISGSLNSNPIQIKITEDTTVSFVAQRK